MFAPRSVRARLMAPLALATLTLASCSLKRPYDENGRDDGRDDGVGGEPGCFFGGCEVPPPAPPPDGGPIALPPPDLEKIASADVPPPPISGGTLAVLSDNRHAVVSDADRDRVYVVHLKSGDIKATVALERGDEPGRLVQDDKGRVHVSLRRASAIATFDPKSGAVLGRRNVCANPRGLAIDGASLHVACADGHLVTLPTEPAGAPTRDLRLEDDLRDIVVRGDKLLVSRFRSAELLVVGTNGLVTERLNPQAKVSPGGPMATGAGGAGAVSRAPAEFAPKSPGVAWRLIQGPEARAIMLHEEGQDSLIQLGPGGYGSKCGGIVEPAVSEFNPGAPTPVRTSPLLGMTGFAVDVAVSPGGKYIAVANGSPSMERGMTNVTYLPHTDASFKNDGSVFCPGPPSEPMVPDTGNGEPIPDPEALPEPVAYQRLSTPEEAVAVAFDKRGNLIVQLREPAQLVIVTQNGRRISLAKDSRADTGHRMFHMTTIGGIACASCHPEGGEDGRVWNFDRIGPRRTQTMRGGLGRTAPFHWDGDMKDITTLMNEVLSGRMGGPRLSPDHGTALLKFIDAIPAMTPPKVADDTAVARGKQLFVEAQCGTCHTGPDLTNNGSVDVGTGKAFQTPTLKGLRYRTPLMHDGCAKTIAGRFGDASCGGSKHGATDKLTQAQIADLVAYLETL